MGPAPRPNVCPYLTYPHFPVEVQKSQFLPILKHVPKYIDKCINSNLFLVLKMCEISAMVIKQATLN